MTGYYSKKYGFSENDFPISSSWGNGTLSIPLFPGITPEEHDYVIEILVTKIDKMIGVNKI
jgi:UDP-4-amino-4-deoxy-L-arabinose-oxoglutarate aminotransferase